jgi:hypothetical protein
LKRAAQEERILVTLDKHFLQLIFHRSQPHCGLIRLPDLPAAERILLLERILRTHGEDLARSAIVSVRGDRIRLSLQDNAFSPSPVLRGPGTLELGVRPHLGFPEGAALSSPPPLDLHLPVPHVIHGFDPEPRPELPKEAMRSGAHVVRNPWIYARLSDAGLVTRAGTGIRRIVRLVVEATVREVGIEVRGFEVLLTSSPAAPGDRRGRRRTGASSAVPPSILSKK